MLRNLIETAHTQVNHRTKPSRSSTKTALRRRQRRRDTESSLDVEPLERRQMLAGDVSAILTNAGTLRITGTNDANQITITDDGVGHIEINGKPGTGTSVNGAVSHVFLNTINSEITRDLIINMRGGDDFVEIDDIFVARNTRMNMGTDNDTVGMFDTRVEGRLTVSLSSGDDLIGFSRTSVGGNMRITGAAGVDTVGFAHCFSANSRVNINTGTGSDAILLQGEFDEPVVVSAGTGDDLLRTNRMFVHDSVRFQLGGGNDELVVGSAWSSFAPFNLTVVGGPGFDTLVEHPLAPIFTMRTIEAGLSNPNADSIIDDAIAAVSLAYVFRGGDPSDLPCP